MNIIRFAINNAESYDVNRLPPGVEGDKSLMMWKELCRSGVFTDADGVEHKIDEAFLQNLVDLFFIRKQKGIEVPCPLGHTHDPELKRGRVIYLELRKQNGAVSLYGIIEFVDSEAKRKLCHSNVSIESPETVSDGDGTTHHFALEHVAFTDYPVVSGLEEFKDVSFSIHKEKKTMPKKKFSEEDEDDKKMSKGRKFSDEKEEKDDKQLENSDSDDDEKDFKEEDQKEPKKFSKRKRCSRKFSEDEDEDDDKELENSDSDEDEEDDDEDEKKLSKRKRFSFNPHFAGLMKQNRELIIEGLARDGKITPQQADYLSRRYCSEKAVRFALDSGGNETFDAVAKILAMNSGLNFDEQTGVQFSRDNNRYDGSNQSNPLMAIFDKKYGGNK